MPGFWLPWGPGLAPLDFVRALLPSTEQAKQPGTTPTQSRDAVMAQLQAACDAGDVAACQQKMLLAQVMVQDQQMRAAGLNPTNTADIQKFQQMQATGQTFGTAVLGQLGTAVTGPIQTPYGMSDLTPSTSGVFTGQGEGFAYPFDPKFLHARTETFRETPGEAGNDFAMPVGTPIFAAFDGDVSTEDGGKTNWGKRIIIKGSAGLTMAVGHLHEFAVTSGHVHRGQLIGFSGGATNDPSSGNTTGPHIEFQLLRQGSHGMTFIDPWPWLQGVFSGQNSMIPTPPDGFATPDGHFIYNGSPEATLYNMAKTIWNQVYGSDPPWSVIDAMRKAGVRNTEQMRDVLNGMPSHIPGVTIGQYENVGTAADQLAKKYFGRPVPGSLIKQFFAQGITTPEQIAAWFLNHPGSDIPKEDYQAIYDVANQFTQDTWGTTPHPDQVAAIYNGTSAVTPDVTQTPTERAIEAGRVKEPAHGPR